MTASMQVAKEFVSLSKVTSIVSFLGIFGVLAYVLGRVHLEAYYKAFGISLASLTLRLEDYTFSSIELDVAIFVFVWLVFWEVRQRGLTSLLKSSAAQRVGIAEPKGWRRTLTGVGLLLTALILFLMLLDESGRTLLDVKGLWGIAAALSFASGYIGVLLLFRMRETILLVSYVLFLLLLPLWTPILARAEVSRDLDPKQGLPAVTVSYVESNTGISGNLMSANALTMGKLIVINNGVLYIWLEGERRTQGIPLDKVSRIDYSSVR